MFGTLSRILWDKKSLNFHTTSFFNHQRRKSTIDDLKFTHVLPPKSPRLSLSADVLCDVPLFPNYPTPFINSTEIVIMEEVGSGFWGIVYKAWYRQSRKLVAVKTLHAFGSSNHLLDELDVLLKCRGDHLVLALGIMVDGWNVSVVMEWMDGGSFEGYGKIPESILASVSKSVLLGLEELQSRYRICHCDLKPSNILYNTQGAIKICDFGESRQRRQKYYSGWSGTAGSEAYMPPERIASVTKTMSRLTEKSDIWSLGVTVHELATGQHPFNTEASLVELVETMTQEHEPRLCKQVYSDQLRDFCASCMIKDITQRSTIKELLKHDFIKLASDERDVSKWAQQMISDCGKSQSIREIIPN